MKKLVVILLSVFAFVACSKDDSGYDSGYNSEFDYPTDHFDYVGQMRYFAQFIERGLPEKLPEGWYREEIHKDSRGEGLRANPFQMFVVDEEGNTLIDNTDKSTWPEVICKDVITSDHYGAHVRMDNSDKQTLPYFAMMAPTSGEHTDSFKLLLLGKEYEIKITYLYMLGAIGACCYPYIFRWDINGELLYSDLEDVKGVNSLGTSHQAVVTIKKDGTLSIERIWEK